MGSGRWAVAMVVVVGVMVVVVAVVVVVVVVVSPLWRQSAMSKRAFDTCRSCELHAFTAISQQFEFAVRSFFICLIKFSRDR